MPYTWHRSAGHTAETCPKSSAEDDINRKLPSSKRFSFWSGQTDGWSSTRTADPLTHSTGPRRGARGCGGRQARRHISQQPLPAPPLSGQPPYSPRPRTSRFSGPSGKHRPPRGASLASTHRHPTRSGNENAAPPVPRVPREGQPTLPQWGGGRCAGSTAVRRVCGGLVQAGGGSPAVVSLGWRAEARAGRFAGPGVERPGQPAPPAGWRRPEGRGESAVCQRIPHRRSAARRLLGGVGRCVLSWCFRYSERQGAPFARGAHSVRLQHRRHRFFVWV